VLHISNGLAALKMVRTLILLDYLLPDMDGLEYLDRLRESKGMGRNKMGMGTVGELQLASCTSRFWR
jgi:CheY-like chemotaxis protein